MRLSLVFFFLFTSFGFCQSIYAATGEECAKNDNDAERLACYDNIFKSDQKAAKTEPQADEKEKGWYVWKSQSKIDDSVSDLIILLSDNLVNQRAGKLGYGTIGIKCHQKTTTITFSAGKIFLIDDDDYGRVTYRLDKEKAKIKQMDVSNDNETLGLWSGSKSIPLIKEMFGHDKMIVQITPYRETPVTMEFTIKGLEEAIKPLREACGW